MDAVRRGGYDRKRLYSDDSCCPNLTDNTSPEVYDNSRIRLGQVWFSLRDKKKQFNFQVEYNHNKI